MKGVLLESGNIRNQTIQHSELFKGINIISFKCLSHSGNWVCNSRILVTLEHFICNLCWKCWELSWINSSSCNVLNENVIQIHFYCNISKAKNPLITFLVLFLDKKRCTFAEHSLCLVLCFLICLFLIK